MPRARKVNPPLAKGKKRKATSDLKEDVADSKAQKNEEPTTSTDQEIKAEIKKVTFSGTVPVDEQCPITGYHVYIDKSVTGPFAAYNATLNQTNIGANNNKYYILQLLEHDSRREYHTWFRWGRVGKVAGNDCKAHGGNLDAAAKAFLKKFREKTGNDWQKLRLPVPVLFEKKKGKYDLLEMDYGETDENAEKDKNETDSKPVKSELPSKLDPRVLEVIDLIFNIEEFEACVKEMEFDVKKAPLGKLTANQIKAGYETLKKIEKCIQEGKVGGTDLAEACSQFYTRIPHDFGMKRPPLISKPQQLKKKIELLEALADIQIAVQMMKDDENDEQDKANIKDRHYDSLNCKLEPFDEESDDFQLVKKYVANSHGSTHGQYDLAVENVYKVEREGDNERFKENIDNKMLLWHGSRLTNWCGILKQGLRIAPPEAPVTGYMFGKGVYFADMVSKSANYCFTNPKQPCGFLLLCEVALGKTNDKIQSDYHADRLPKGKTSTKGVGREFPDPKGDKTLDCGTIVPLGKPICKGNDSGLCLMYNEFIVYDVAQIRARYLVKLNFNYKKQW